MKVQVMAAVAATAMGINIALAGMPVHAASLDEFIVEEQVEAADPAEEAVPAEEASKEDTAQVETPADVDAPVEEHTQSDKEVFDNSFEGEATTPEDPKEEETIPEDPKEEETTPEVPKEEETTPEVPKEEETTPETPKEEETTPEVSKDEEQEEIIIELQTISSTPVVEEAALVEEIVLEQNDTSRHVATGDAGTVASCLGAVSSALALLLRKKNR